MNEPLFQDTHPPADYDLICFSHLRWDFVFQRPQHLMTRFAASGRVFFIEEPVWYDGPTRLDIRHKKDGLYICVPQIAHGTPPEIVQETVATQVCYLLSSPRV